MRMESCTVVTYSVTPDYLKHAFIIRNRIFRSLEIDQRELAGRGDSAALLSIGSKIFARLL